MDSTASDHKEDEKFSMSDQQTLTDDDTSESDQDENLQRTKHVDEGCDSGNLLYKNTSSFRCLAQILLSSSSLMKNRLYLFPPLDDPGIDEAFNYEEPHLNVDEIGIEKYVNLCKELRIVPITRVKKSLEGPELNLRFYGLTAKQLRAVTDTLKLNSYVEVLDLQDNFLDPYMTGLVSSMLEENTSLRIVRMRQCRIGVKGAEKFNDALSGSQFLTELDLSFNKLGDEGLKCLQQGLSETQSMRRLNIGHNDLTEVSVETLEKMLNENKTLNDINLSWNNFSTGPGNKRLFNAFLQNDRIKNLNMAWNGISLRAALTPIVKFVKNSETLERLDLSNNRITGKPSRKLRTAISKNHSLVEVRVGSNPITPVDALFIASVLALPEKANEPLEHLDMENIYFNKEVVPLLTRVQRMGKTLNIGGVLGNWEIMGPNLNKLVFDRCRYLLMKPKKKKFQKDFGHFILSLPDKPIPRQDFDLLLKKKKIKKLDKDLIDELTSKFVLKKKIDCVELTKAYMELYPNTTLPVVEKKPKKGRRKKKEKVVDIEKELATVDLDGGQQENAEKTPVDLKVGSQSVATKEKLPSLDEGKMGEKGESLPKIAIEGGGNEGIEKRFIEDEGIEKVFFDDEGVEESSTEDEGVEKIGLEGVGIAN